MPSDDDIPTSELVVYVLVLYAFSAPWIRNSFGAGRLFFVFVPAFPDFTLPMPPPAEVAARPFWLWF
jgi:hypothetical protein